MNYNEIFEIMQSENERNYIKIPSLLNDFHNTETTISKTKTNRNMYYINGVLGITDNDYICDNCGIKMHINNNFHTVLKHLPVGPNLSCVCFNKLQLYCDNCGHSKMQNIPFKCKNHRITNELYTYTCDLLESGYTNKQVSQLTGLCKNVVKDIDLERLKNKYTVNGDGKELIKPEKYAKYLGIDEFKLHNGNIMATHIIDLETGHILWISQGKKKQVVYDFINHVGIQWMNNVVAVACDMNSDFQEAFEEKCPHLKIVFDYFHIIKNFNDKVINEIRKDEKKRLTKQGNLEAVNMLKKSKYILISSRDNLKKKDELSKKQKTITKGSELFHTTKEIELKGGNEDWYNKLLKENELLFTVDLVKEKLKYAFSCDKEAQMIVAIIEIIDLCFATKNKHFIWFAKLLLNHRDGIISHSLINISSGKIEGINNKIKTLRRQAYGYPDDEYFFLKLFDMSRH